MRPLHRRQTPRRVLGLVALLAWLGVAWTFWQGQIAVPRQIIQLGYPIKRFPAVSAGHPITTISPSQDELAFIDATTGQKQNLLNGDMRGIIAVIAARNQKTLATLDNEGTRKIWHTAED